MIDSTARPSAAATLAPTDPTSPPIVGFDPLLEQLEMYARDVRALHEQRTRLADELRKIEHRLAAAMSEQARLRERLEKEHARVTMLEQARLSKDTTPPPVPASGGRAVLAGVAAGVMLVLGVGAVLLLLASQLLPIFVAAPAAVDPPAPPRIADTPAPTTTAAAAIVVSTAPTRVSTAAAADPGRAAADPGRPPPTTSGAMSFASPAAATAVPDASARCALDLTVPVLPPKTAYVLRFEQTRPGQVSLLWPSASGKIGLAATGPAIAGARTPAIVRLSDLPSGIAQSATAVAELTSDAPAGGVFALLINDSNDRLPQSRGLLYYAGADNCR